MQPADFRIFFFFFFNVVSWKKKCMTNKSDFLVDLKEMNLISIIL